MENKIKLIFASMADARILLDWRNDPETRKASKNEDIIEVEVHRKWLANVLKDPNRQLYIAHQYIVGSGASHPVGTCRADYDPESDSYELSWTVAPEARGRGTGKWMVAILAQQLSDKYIYAEIKQDNIASMKIAKFAGMKLRDVPYKDIYLYNRGPI